MTRWSVRYFVMYPNRIRVAHIGFIRAGDREEAEAVARDFSAVLIGQVFEDCEPKTGGK